ncbi:M17 family metallopeptidase [uncultured Tateyamaria sp.]|uniref:leucyl aminopeptidase family protein n=1 Tax=uncultured Tateyamaria sp. TaxID=455651 RepID=UPI0026041DE9|nr:leucyl aminopeptidase family protein [uncultured Tateyamaria sp.]
MMNISFAPCDVAHTTIVPLHMPSSGHEFADLHNGSSIAEILPLANLNFSQTTAKDISVPDETCLSTYTFVTIAGDDDTDMLRRLGANCAETILKRVEDCEIALNSGLVNEFEHHHDGTFSFFLGLFLGLYRQTKVTSMDDGSIPCISVALPHHSNVDRNAVKRACLIAEIVHFVRDLISAPPNILSPAGFERAVAEKAAAIPDLDIQVYNERQLTELGLRAFVAVGRASCEPSRMIVLRWKPEGEKPDLISLIGKAVTFDAGGLCIQPGKGMDEMKGDMAGGAIAVGAVLAAAITESKGNVSAYIGVAENVVGSNAFRPADVLTMCNGTTVEVTNTDAEGRLILADIMSWVSANSPPRAMIDIGTLTGTMLSALGNDIAGFFSNDRALSESLRASAHVAGEKVWEMPLDDCYLTHLKSESADLKHFSYEGPGAITAALFLREFAGSIPWIHMDIGSNGMNTRRTAESPGWASGAGVLTLLDLMRTEKPA